MCSKIFMITKKIINFIKIFIYKKFTNKIFISKSSLKKLYKMDSDPTLTSISVVLEWIIDLIVINGKMMSLSTKIWEARGPGFIIPSENCLTLQNAKVTDGEEREWTVQLQLRWVILWWRLSRCGTTFSGNRSN